MIYNNNNNNNSYYHHINIYYYYYYLIIIIIYIIIPKINFPLLFILISMNYLSVHRSTPWAAFRIRKNPQQLYHMPNE